MYGPLWLVTDVLSLFHRDCCRHCRLMEKFEARPSRGAALVPWLRAVMVQHTAYLMTVPGLVHKLARLYQTVDARLVVFKKLLKLSGRLDLVLSQLAERGGTPGPSVSRPTARRVVDEGGSDAADGSSNAGSDSDL